ncbi:hypothetical protein AZE42_01309 [Rhizopogon vesiculosus]|uniref:Uncharacterized protein n=1 Tax=Rhizopogon vesiculosus TaxID=180088 RepID=A0A1J8Q667_9AGAM|nr:hypothetical protein AZE42_01309 [Rhizopogon vesiculosus]
MSKFAPHRRSNNHPKASSATICQKCLGTGLLAKLKAEGKPSVEVPEEFRIKYVDHSGWNSTDAVARSGTANRILEAKEVERKVLEGSKGKAKEEDERTRKKARRLLGLHV